MATKTVSFKVDDNWKTQFDRIAASLGLTPSALLNVFVKKTIDENGIPFDMKVMPSYDVTSLPDDLKREMIKSEEIALGLRTEDEKALRSKAEFMAMFGDE